MSRRAVHVGLVLVLGLSACGERVAQPNERSPGPDLARPDTAPVAPATPVRIGEAGPSFRACQAAGTPRNGLGRDVAGAPVPVRVAPFEGARVVARVPPGARMFVCTRSIDQRWLGIVYAPDGTLSPACGVSVPAARRANYAGPCGSGWVSSATVRLVAE